jgi:hypothetical protein
MSNEKQKTQFDPDFSPEHPTNKQAARDHGLKYDPRSRTYKDSDGCQIRDRFGQPLG